MKLTFSTFRRCNLYRNSNLETLNLVVFHLTLELSSFLPYMSKSMMLYAGLDFWLCHIIRTMTTKSNMRVSSFLPEATTLTYLVIFQVLLKNVVVIPESVSWSTEIRLFCEHLPCLISLIVPLGWFIEHYVRQLCCKSYHFQDTPCEVA